MQSQKPLKSGLKLGTRGSPLALKQAEEVKARLISAHGMAENDIEIVVMKTTGDRFTDRPLSAIGGKGLFTKELEEGLYSGEIDCAVHSTKDVATVLPEGLKLAVILEREDVRDAFVSITYRSIEDLPNGAVFGTSSLRRKAQLLNLRPDLKVVEFRGTVGTRLEKLEANVAQASFLAMAGLNRLGRDDLLGRYAHPIDTAQMLPAAAQGAISIEIRESDDDIASLLQPLHDAPTAFAVNAERAFLRVLDGSCRTPIAAYFDGETLRGEVLSLDGQTRLSGEWTGDDAQELGERAGRDLLAQGAAHVLG